MIITFIILLFMIKTILSWGYLLKVYQKIMPFDKNHPPLLFNISFNNIPAICQFKKMTPNDIHFKITLTENGNCYTVYDFVFL